MHLTRRDFLAAVPAFLLAPKLSNVDQPPVRLALIHSPEYANAVRAAEMSAAEARRAAALLKREFHFETFPSSAPPPSGEWTGIILAAPGDFKLVATAVDITGTRCGRGVLTLRSIRAKCKHGCTLWHPSLERFGAGQLNDRFHAAGITIDEQAWLGWFAVKLLWEAGARGADPAKMQYDGHKGMALHFNQAGILVQPYYMLDVAGNISTEVRDRAVLEQVACES